MEQLSAKEAKALSKRIDRELRKEAQIRKHEAKLLLLGAGESGKSTIAKQMKILHLSGFSNEERRAWIKIIHTNVLASTVALIEGANKLRIPITQQAAAKHLVDYCAGTSEDTVDNFLDLNKDLAADITSLWEDAGIQQAFTRSSEFQLDDSAAYIIPNVQRLVADDYLPTDQDLLRARLRTTSVTEVQWIIDGIRFRMIDVGGQRGERSKWIHQFEDVTAIIYCVGISEYDQVIREDGKTNRLHESLDVFSAICQNEWLAGKPIILFLNKKDIFAEKIKRVGLNVCFPDYNGPNDFKAASSFIEKKFTQAAKKTNTPLFPQVTCATDTENVLFVWNAVKEITLREILGEIF